MSVSTQTRNALVIALGHGGYGAANEIINILNGAAVGNITVPASNGLDTATAGALNIGATTATSVVITPNTTISGNLTLADAKNLVVGTTTGTQIGTATTQKLGFFGQTPAAQPTSASEAAVATTAPTNTSPYGYTTSAQAAAIVTLVNQLRADLVTLGLIKGA